jgi:hypothetical protein
MSTIFGGEKSSADNTNGRSGLWDAAVKVWMAHPVMGVGGRNYGVYIAAQFGRGEIHGTIANNPSQMYDAAIHNMYLQILSEDGIIGFCLYLWLIVDFFRRNHRLRSPYFRAAWVDRGGGAVDLKWLSVGLASMMIAILSNGFFYNVLYMSWLPCVLAINGVVYQLSKPLPVPAAVVRRAFPINRLSAPQSVILPLQSS